MDTQAVLRRPWHLQKTFSAILLSSVYTTYSVCSSVQGHADVVLLLGVAIWVVHREPPGPCLLSSVALYVTLILPLAHYASSLSNVHLCACKLVSYPVLHSL